jgi:hypothetical protein
MKGYIMEGVTDHDKQGRSFPKTEPKTPTFRRTQFPGHGPYVEAGAGTKVFCFFSSEKKTFACLA